jgi:transposase
LCPTWIIAEVGPTAATFPSAKQLSSWVGACPGNDESAGVNYYSHRSPKVNGHMRRVLNQAANAAARTKGSIFEIVYRRLVPRLGHNQTIGAIAHRQRYTRQFVTKNGSSRHQTIKTKAYDENDPAAAKPRLSDRTTEPSTPQSAIAP